MFARHAVLALCANDNKLLIFEGCRSPDFSSWRLAHVLEEHDLIISGISWSPVTNKIVTCSHDRNAFVWTYDSTKASAKRAPSKCGVAQEYSFYQPRQSTFRCFHNFPYVEGLYKMGAIAYYSVRGMRLVAGESLATLSSLRLLRSTTRQTDRHDNLRLTAHLSSTVVMALTSFGPCVAKSPTSYCRSSLWFTS